MYQCCGEGKYFRKHLSCIECHRQFKTMLDLALHTEMCLMEALENEALTVYSDTPVDKAYNAVATPYGVVAKASSGYPVPGRPLEVRLCGTERKQEMAPSTSASRVYAKYESPARRVPRNYVEMEPEPSRTIEGPRGLRLMVSVEREEAMEENQLDDEIEELEEIAEEPGEDYNGDYQYTHRDLQMEENEEMQGEEDEDELSDSQSQRFQVKRRVIGALANADDDPLKPKMECPTCGLVLYRHNFATHYRIHTGELPFGCPFCEKRFRASSAMKVHIRAHTGEKPYVCPSCDYSAMTKRNLDRHVLNNHVRSGERKGPRMRRSRYRESQSVNCTTSMKTVERRIDPREDHQYEAPPHTHQSVHMEERESAERDGILYKQEYLGEVEQEL